jgi:hypothetical protein
MPGDAPNPDINVNLTTTKAKPTVELPSGPPPKPKVAPVEPEVPKARGEEKEETQAAQQPPQPQAEQAQEGKQQKGKSNDQMMQLVEELEDFVAKNNKALTDALWSGVKAGAQAVVDAGKAAKNFLETKGLDALNQVSDRASKELSNLESAFNSLKQEFSKVQDFFKKDDKQAGTQMSVELGTTIDKMDNALSSLAQNAPSPSADKPGKSQAIAADTTVAQLSQPADTAPAATSDLVAVCGDNASQGLSAVEPQAPTPLATDTMSEEEANAISTRPRSP